MGNDNSQEDDRIPKSPIILSLRDSMRLKFIERNLTKSLVYQAFANQFMTVKNGIMERKMNPFCVLELNEDKQNYEEREWITCCLISPIMAIASPIFICRQDSTFYRSCRVRGMSKDKDVYAQVEDIIHLDAHHVVFLILREPLWQLGWAGLTYLSDPKQIESGVYKLINHPERKMSKQNPSITYIQKIVAPYLKSSHNGFKANNKDAVGSMVCTIVERKPFVVGLQISLVNILFFDEEFLTKAQSKVNEYLSEKNREKQFLKKIDIDAYEEQTQW